MTRLSVLLAGSAALAAVAPALAQTGYGAPTSSQYRSEQRRTAELNSQYAQSGDDQGGYDERGDRGDGSAYDQSMAGSTDPGTGGYEDGSNDRGARRAQRRAERRAERQGYGRSDQGYPGAYGQGSGQDYADGGYGGPPASGYGVRGYAQPMVGAEQGDYGDQGGYGGADGYDGPDGAMDGAGYGDGPDGYDSPSR